MQQSQPGRAYPATRPPKWLWVLPVLTFGALSVVPVLVIAAKLRQKLAWLIAGGLSSAWFLGFTLVGIEEDGQDTIWTNVGVSLYFAAFIGSIVYALVLAPRLDWSRNRRSSVAAPMYDPNTAAVHGVQVDRQRREQARELVRRDPQMARELGIGRPDLPRQYDDGGLVDVNHAPAATVAGVLGLSDAQSAEVVEVRDQLGGFEHADDLVNLAGLELSAYDQVKHRIVLL